MILPNSIPPAPWVLRGEAISHLASPFAVRLLVNYHESPVGPYLEHALAKMTLRGPHVFQMSVDLEASKIGGREIWGYPKEIENLAWKSRGSHLEFRRESQIFRFRKFGPRFPLKLAFWTVQTLRGAQVRVPGSIRATARLAFRGRQLALYLETFEMKFEPPVGIKNEKGKIKK